MNRALVTAVVAASLVSLSACSDKKVQAAGSSSGGRGAAAPSSPMGAASADAPVGDFCKLSANLVDHALQQLGDTPDQLRTYFLTKFPPELNAWKASAPVTLRPAVNTFAAGEDRKSNILAENGWDPAAAARAGGGPSQDPDYQDAQRELNDYWTKTCHIDMSGDGGPSSSATS